MNGAVEIDDLPLLLVEGIDDGLQEVCGVGIQVGGAGIGKPFTDIAEARCTEECIDDGVDENICVAVAIKSKGGIFDQHSAEQEWSAWYGAVSVVSFSDAEVGGVHEGVVRVGGGRRRNSAVSGLWKDSGVRPP